MNSVLETDVRKLPGIGPVSSKALYERGIHTLADLIDLIPLDYEDRRTLTALSELRSGQSVMVQAPVKAVQSWFYGGKRLLRVTLTEEAAPGSRAPSLELLWFRPPPGISKRIERGQPLRALGKVQATNKGGWRITHPRLLPLDSEPCIVPRYPRIEGVTVAALQKAIAHGVKLAHGALHDAIPKFLRDEQNLMELDDAYRLLHTPGVALSETELKALQQGRSEANQRLRLETWFQFEVERLTQVPAREHGLKLNADLPSTLAALETLEFVPTAAQQRVTREVLAGLQSAEPMRRLLQGDVGSGKTVIGWLAALQAARSTAQAAFLAPTELLAEQHFTTLSRWASSWNVRVALLTGSLSRKERDDVAEKISSGAVDLVVGTHALFSEGIDFSRLGLVVVDEQHRFGVAQRLRLLEKTTGRTPHLLVMTATPIPRSLAWILYAGMDVSVLDELPPGRIPVQTQMLDRKKYPELRQQINAALKSGGRVFVVCPAIEEREDFISVEKVTSVMQRHFDKDCVTCVHGRLATDEREQRFEQFRSGAKRILVCTTLVEVGVDVPEATLMAIMQAERYGLAQLHQLRGRVGRSDVPASCVLVHGELSEDAQARLETLCELQDGFAIAERDLNLRGPGELMGLRQSGLRLQAGLDLHAELELWQCAKTMAERSVQSDPSLLKSGADESESALGRGRASRRTARVAFS